MATIFPLAGLITPGDLKMNNLEEVSAGFRISAFLLLYSLAVAGCGSSSYMAPPPPNNPVLSSMTGNWEIIFHSQVSPDHYFALETNLTQTGAQVFAGNTSALIFQAKKALQLNGITLARLGGQCDSGTIGDVTVDATISNLGVSSETVAFSVSQQGDLGTTTLTGTSTSDGQVVSNGTYTIPAACGLPEDHGTFDGFRDSIHFVGETYSGTLNGGTDSIVVGITSAASGFDLAASGTHNGTPFSGTGSVVGFSMELNGTISGNDFHWFLLYDSTYNDFQVFDAADNLIGNFQPTH
jgi:hypothetical protein